MKPLIYKRNIVSGLCAVQFCKNKCGGRKLCSTHRSAKTRIDDPTKYAYISLKNNAKRRNIPFTITLTEFRKWCVKVTYIGFSGRSPESETIDRRHNDIGYHIDNIQVMKKIDNIKKYFAYDYRTKAVMVTLAEPITEDGPF